MTDDKITLKETCAKIKSLFEGDNHAICFALLKKGITRVYADDFHDCGLNPNDIVKVKVDGSSSLFSRVVFWEQTIYSGVTVVSQRDGAFSLEPNTFDEEQAEIRMKLRSLQWELEGVKNRIWAYRSDMDMEDQDAADRLEPKVQLLEDEIELLKEGLTN